MKVLVIDDSPEWQEMVKIALAEEGLDIICAESGSEGLAVAQRERPDLILLDIGMPDVSGFDVCQSLQACPDLSTTPIIFVTVFADSQDVIKGMDLGAVDYITKPFNLFELQARVRAALRMKRMQDALVNHAHADVLTGLLNRRGMTECIQQEWARIQRYGGALSLVTADVDHLKGVNDTWGHATGDRMLCRLAQVLSKEARRSDIVARYGGDEFMILCPDVDASGAAQLAERCRHGIQQK